MRISKKLLSIGVGLALAVGWVAAPAAGATGYGGGHGHHPGGGAGCLPAAAAVSSLGLIALNGGIPGGAEIQGQINGAIKNTNTVFQ